MPDKNTPDKNTIDIRYRIEVWDTAFRKYRVAWEGPKQYAETMMNKPYIMRHTRRLIATSEVILSKGLAGKYISK